MRHYCPACGMHVNRIGFQCGCGTVWHRNQFQSAGLNIMDFEFEMEEMQDIAQGDFLGAMEVAVEEEIFDDTFGNNW